MCTEAQIFSFNPIGSKASDFMNSVVNWKFVVNQSISINSLGIGKYYGFDNLIECFLGSWTNSKTDYIFIDSI